MATVTSVTNDTIEARSAPILVDADLSGSSLAFTRKNGTTLNVGAVVDPAIPTTPALVNLTAFDKTTESVVVPDWFTPGVVNPKLTITPGYTSDTFRGVTWSPEGKYLVSGTNISPYLIVWKRSATAMDDWTALSQPAVAPAGIASNPAFSTNGQYLAVPHATSPFITIYKRSVDTFTKLTDPSTLPLSAGCAAAWSPDNTYLAMSCVSAPGLIIYKRSTDTFTKLTDPATMPGISATQAGLLSFSPNGVYLAVPSYTTSPYLYIYKRSGDTFTKLANPATIPTGNCRAAVWSSNGQYLAVTMDVSPFVMIYKRSADTFTKLANPDILPASAGWGAAWSPDMQYLIVTYSTTSPYHIMYKRIGDTFQKVSDLAPLSGNSGGAAWSPDGMYLAISETATPFTVIYKSAMGQPIGVPTPVTLLP